MPSFDISAELGELGFSTFYQQQFLVSASEPEAATARLEPARVVCERRGEYEVMGREGPLRAVLRGRLEHELGAEERPTVGDWVVVEPAEPVGRIARVLERQSVLRRQAVGGTSGAQNLAANVDLCCIVAALTSDEADAHTERRGLNPRRLERYLRTAYESRIPALVVVNKADLASAERAQALLDELSSHLRAVDIELVSARTEHGLQALRERIPFGTTAVLLGSSGVGKSTLVNRLLGHDVQRTGEAREADARGRHTTTERELALIPGGGALIDTPGMRELALFADAESDDGSSGFAEIDTLAAECRFRDCRHRGEPGCAVLAAVETGSLAAERLESAQRLERELLHQRARVDVRLRAAQHREHKQRTRAHRVRAKIENRRE